MGLLLVPAIAGMFLALALFSASRFSVGAFEFSVELIPFQRGDTVIFIPPVGELRAATHWLPLAVKFTLLNVDLENLVSGLESLSALPDISFLEEQLHSRLHYYLLRNSAIIFACGGGAVYLVSRMRNLKRALLGGLLASVLFVALFGITVIRPYNLEAFETPQYRGAISAAPWVVNLSRQTLTTIKTLGRQLELMTANLHDLSLQLDQVRLNEPYSGPKVLHVSDIHNNPAAFDFIEKVVSSFAIDLIIDTGDLTDYGTELETELVSRVSSLPVLYLFVPGNHDSPRIIEALRRSEAVVLENETIELNGLLIGGVADPSAESPHMAVAPEQDLGEAGAAAYAQFFAAGAIPDVIAVHNPLLGTPFTGLSAAILSGHTHRAEVRFERGSALINAGTAGAAGIRGLQSPQDNPYSMVVLYFDRDETGRSFPVMADLLSVQQYHDSFTLKRYYNR